MRQRSKSVLRSALLAVAALLLTIRGLTSSEGLRSDESFAFIHATVIDGTGAAAKPDQTVIIARNHIRTVEQFGRTKIPSGIRMIDATGQFLIPGLWDMHVHTRYSGIDHLRLLVANGVTSTRDMGAPWEHFDVIKRWRKEIQEGTRIGPRLFAAGPLLDGPSSVWSHSAKIASPEAGREIVQRLKKDRADFVKVYDLLSQASFYAIADEAKRQHFSFVGHVPLAVTLAEASDAGQRSIEHIDAILFACSDREKELKDELAAGVAPALVLNHAVNSSFNANKAAALFSRLQRNHTSVVPTLSLFWTVRALATGDAATVKADSLRYVPAAYVEEWSQRPRGSREVWDANFTKIAEVVREVHKAGVELLAGTDVVKPFFVPGFSLHLELSLLVRAGLSEMEALEAATRKPARFMGVADVGTVEPGMVADLVLLDANPLRTIENTQKIAAVVTTGQLIEKRQLQSMLADMEHAAAAWTGTPTGR
jgi:hypothetical protein